MLGPKVRWGVIAAALLLVATWSLSVDPQGPINLDNKVRVSFSRLTFNRATNTFDTVATISNTSAEILGGPMSLVITSITPSGPRTVTLANPTGQTGDGNPYVSVPVPSGGLGPGQSSPVLLKFRSSVGVAFSFTTSVLGVILHPPPPPILAEPLTAGATLVGGTGVAGALVAVEVDGALAGTGTVDSDGHFAVVVSPLTAGAVVRAMQTLNGLTSAPSAPVVVRERPPAPILIPPLVEGSTSVTGTGVPDALVEVFVDGAPVATGVVGPTGTFTIPVPALLAGQQVTATQTVAGLTSAPSAALTVVITPPPPIVSGPLVEGSTNVSGTGIAGATVDVFLDGGTLGSTAVDSTGTWSLAVPPLLVGGTVVARQTVAGVTSAFSAGLTVVAPPPSPIVSSPLVSGSVSIAGTGTPGATVEVFLNGQSLGTTVVGGGGTWSIAVTPLSAGDQVVARQTVAGVVSDLSTVVTVVAPPPPPTVGSPLVAGMTNVPGAGTPGATVEVFVGGISVGTATVGMAGTWTLALADPLEAGDVVEATQSVAGVPSALSAPVTVVAPPPPPTVDSPLAAGETRVSGTGIPGASLRVLADGTVLGSTAVNPDGTWALPLGAPLAAGQVITAIQTVAGLDSAPSDPVTVGAAALVRIDLIPAPTATIAKGQTLSFMARGTFSDGAVQEPLGGVAWSSDAPAVATIDASGVATGVAPGTARISASQSGVQSAATTLTVTPAILTRIDITPGPVATVPVGQTLTFGARGTFSDGSVQDPLSGVTWNSDTPTTATIDAAGLAMGVAPGMARITASRDGVQSAATTLTVTAVTPPAPTITGFIPASGRVGDVVTITGTNFVTVQSVTFGRVTAIVASLTPTTIQTVVPPGAGTGPITVRTAGGIATSGVDFVLQLRQDFQLAMSPASGIVVRGVFTTYVVEITSSGAEAFTGLASLAVDPLPPGITVVLSPSMLTGGQRGTLTLTADLIAPLGSTMVTVRATVPSELGPVTRTASSMLSVQAAGQTALTGRFTMTDGTPLAGVQLTLAGQSTVTDAGGNFQFLDLATTGVQTLSINVTPVNPSLPIYGVDVTLGAGVITLLPPFQITQPPPPERFTPISNAIQDQTVSDARFPGFSITLPAGVTITGWDGVLKNKIAVERLTPDRLAVPPPPGFTRSVYQIFFGTPMGGLPSAPLPVTVPNDLDFAPGEKAEIWYYDAAPFAGVPAGWRMAGLGTVSADGTTVVSDPGVGIARFCGVCGSVCILRNQDNTDNRNPDGPTNGDPIDVFLGQMIVEKTDLVLPGRIPAVVHRTYNPFDAFSRIAGFELSLGPGWALSVDTALLENVASRRLVLPGDARFDFVLQPNGSFVNTTHPRFAGAVLTATSGGGHLLRFRDQTVWRFAGGWTSGGRVIPGLGLLVEQIDRNGNRLTIERDARGKLTRLVEPSGRALTSSLDASGRIVSVRDLLDRTVSYTYGIDTRLETVTDPAGGVTRYTYDASGRILTITDPKGIVFIRNEYANQLDGRTRIVRQEQADGGVWSFEYDFAPICLWSDGNCGFLSSIPVPPLIATRITDPRGNVTTYKLTATGFSSEVTDALGQTTRYERDARGQPLSITDPLGRQTQFTYDGNGNVTSVTDPAGNARTFTYHPVFNRVTSLTDPLGNITTLDYDSSNGNVLTVTDPLGNATSIAYNSSGQPISITDALGNITRLTYTVQGDFAAITDPLGNKTLRHYDAISRLTRQIDPRGALTRYTYDNLNQPTQVLDALGGATTFSYDPNGNPLTVTDARGNTTTYTYDAMDRVVTRTDPLGRIETSSYDPNGKLAQFTDRNGQMSTFTYDALNRRTRSTFGDGASVETAYDAVGRLVRASNSGSIAVFREYDALDRLTREVTTQGAIAYTYDALGRRTTMSVNEDPPIVYTYDANGRVTSLVQGAAAVSLTYDGLSRRRELSYSNGTSVQYTYDAADRVVRILHRGPASTIEDLTYTYDAAGYRASFDRGSLPAVLPERLSATYDAANQLIQFNATAPNLTYDGNGNLIRYAGAAGDTVYVWDARNQLVRVDGPDQSSPTGAFAYDPFGRRVSKTIGGMERGFLYDGLDVITESNGGRVEARYLRGLDVDEAFMRRGLVDEFYHGDALNSVVFLTDNGGEPRTTYSYEPFGRTTIAGAMSTNPFQYTGRENDATALYYYRARYYAPNLHRFLGEDPIPSNALERNLYSYGRNSPLNFIDPFGLQVIGAMPPGAKVPPGGRVGFGGSQPPPDPCAKEETPAGKAHCYEHVCKHYGICKEKEHEKHEDQHKNGERHELPPVPRVPLGPCLGSPITRPPSPTGGRKPPEGPPLPDPCSPSPPPLSPSAGTGSGLPFPPLP